MIRAALALIACAMALVCAGPARADAGRPGDVLRAEPMRAQLVPGVALPARAWRVLYRSRTPAGRPTAVSGTVLVPTERWTGGGARPLVGYAVGTQGMADRCAASRQLAAGTEYEAALIAQVLSRGWAVALTDYPGLGTPGSHTYVAGRALGRSVLDAMRAALRLPAAGLDRAAPLGIYGYSEGGEAAGWAIALQPRYAPDLPLAGGAVGAAPADFFRELDYLNGTPAAFLIMWSAIGFDAAYPGLGLDRILTPAGRAFRAKIEDTCLVASSDGRLGEAPVAAQQEPHDAYRWFTASSIAGLPAWKRRFEQNALARAVPRTPVILGAGRGDEVMVYETSGPGLYRAWCARGANVRFDDIPLSIPGLYLFALQHLAGGAQFASPAFGFLADRFAGKAAARPADCRSAGAR